ncbi:MAG TPA: hypothetical protein VGQ39_06795 [Pyrinomonadaceae bacterium]|nr:hypothetical protein [Pyrinomonadaceae bacterium]
MTRITKTIQTQWNLLVSSVLTPAYLAVFVDKLKFIGHLKGVIHEP